MRTLHVFGGGKYVEYMAPLAQKYGFRILVRTSQRLENSFNLEESDNTKILCGNNLLDLMNDDKPKEQDIGISFSAPWILGPKIIASFCGNLYNLHGQPLPLFRGAGGYSWNILECSSSGGISIHELTSEIDGGRLVAQTLFEFPIQLRTPYDYEEFAQKKAFQLLNHWFDSVVLGRVLDTTRNNLSELSTYWPRLNTPTHGWINWSWPTADIVSFIKAFSNPYIGAHTHLGKLPVRVNGCSIEEYQGNFHPFQYGLITRIVNGTYFVAHHDGYIVLDSINPVNPTSDINARLGDRLYTPSNILDEAMATRVQYSPGGEIMIVNHTM